MRDIICKARTIKGKRWMYGAYNLHINRTPCPMGDSIQESDKEHYLICDAFSDWNMPRGMDAHPIYPETVCQYTGKQDKKNIRIFENDIIEYGWMYRIEYLEDEVRFRAICTTSEMELPAALWGEALVVGNVYNDSKDNIHTLTEEELFTISEVIDVNNEE